MAKKQKPLTGIDPRKIFDRAEQFHWSYRRLCTNTDKKTERIVAIPALVLAAFASELYLKCLHMIDKGAAPPGHDLKDLFDALPRLRQTYITRLWDKIATEQRPILDKLERTIQTIAPGAKIPRDLDAALRECSRGFEQLRYEYEDKNFKFYIPELTRALRLTILKIYPTWENDLPDTGNAARQTQPTSRSR